MSVSVTTEPLDAFLARQRRATDGALARVLAAIAARGRVAEAVRYALAGGGKRLRPALCTAAYEAVAAAAADERVADLGAAVELIHTYSLIHDDLPCMDDDAMRRGRPTTHRACGEPAAMLAGAALIPLAFRLADDAVLRLGMDGAARTAVARTLAQGAGAAGMVGGQAMDLAAGAQAVDRARLEAIHAAKTGALLTAACRLGGIAAGAAGETLAALDRYGRHLGLAFQIADDILDETASTEQLGKTAGKDRQAAKATFPALLGLDQAATQAGREAAAAIAAVESAGIASDTLVRLARFAVERKQ